MDTDLPQYDISNGFRSLPHACFPLAAFFSIRCLASSPLLFSHPIQSTPSLCLPTPFPGKGAFNKCHHVIARRVRIPKSHYHLANPFAFSPSTSPCRPCAFRRSSSSSQPTCCPRLRDHYLQSSSIKSSTSTADLTISSGCGLLTVLCAVHGAILSKVSSSIDG